MPTGIPGLSDPAAFVTVINFPKYLQLTTIRNFRARLTDEVLNTQLGHNSDRKHDFLECITFVCVELKSLISGGWD